MIRPLLVMPCSARKSRTLGLLPAGDRYDGPTWRTLRANRKGLELDVLVLSAAHGFIWEGTHIADYDRKLDAARADELAFDISAPWAREKAQAAPHVFLMGGGLYLDVMLEVLFGGSAAIMDAERVEFPTCAAERRPGIGEQMACLKEWLGRMRLLQQAAIYCSPTPIAWGEPSC